MFWGGVSQEATCTYTLQHTIAIAEVKNALGGVTLFTIIKWRKRFQTTTPPHQPSFSIWV